MHYRLGMRRRLRFCNPAGGTGRCSHVRKNGTVCGCLLGADYGHHTVTCKPGVGVMLRHNNIRDGITGWLKELGRGPARNNISHTGTGPTRTLSWM